MLYVTSFNRERFLSPCPLLCILYIGLNSRFIWQINPTPKSTSYHSVSTEFQFLISIVGFEVLLSFWGKSPAWLSVLLFIKSFYLYSIQGLMSYIRRGRSEMGLSRHLTTQYDSLPPSL